MTFLLPPGIKGLTLSLPVPRWPGDNTVLPTSKQHLESNESKHCLYGTFFKQYSISFLMVCRLMDFAFVVLKLLMFKVCGIIGISKIEFINFSGTEKVN